jgi:hypothetical protein
MLHISSWTWQEQAAEQPLPEQPLLEQPLPEQPLPEQPVRDALRSFHHNTNHSRHFPPGDTGQDADQDRYSIHWPL